MDWQPIKTAPKDGTPILIVADDLEMRLVTWVCYDDLTAAFEIAEIDGGGSVIFGGVATHWMPLPEPPVDYYGIK